MSVGLVVVTLNIMKILGVFLKNIWSVCKQIVLPKYCFGCGLSRVLLCRECEALMFLRPREKSMLIAPIVGSPPIWVLGEYRGLLKKLILLQKQFRIPSWRLLAWESGYRYLQGIKLSLNEKGGKIKTPILVIPAPSATRTIWERPVYWFARGVVDAINSSTNPTAYLWDGLCLPKKVGKQAGKNLLERSQNRHLQMFIGQVKDRLPKDEANFNWGLDRISQATVYLCDDVITTGATVNEMVRVLKAEKGRVSGIFCLAYVRNLSKTDV